MKELLRHPVAHFAATGGVLVVASVIAFAPDAYLPMLVRSFLPWWVLSFMVLGMWNLFRRNRSTGLVCAATSLLMMPGLDTPIEAPITPISGRGLRIVHVNVYQPNEQHDQVIARLLAQEADVIGVQEVSSEWRSALLEGLSGSYPYHRISARSNCYGIALFSRIPLNEVHVFDLEGSPAIEAILPCDDDQVHLFFVHAASPGDPGAYDRRGRQFDRLEERLASIVDPCAVIGDLNATPWDPSLVRLCQRGLLRTTASVFSPTWPAVVGLPLIPIDHLLVRQAVHIGEVDTFTIPGSDHRGLNALIALAP